MIRIIKNRAFLFLLLVIFVQLALYIYLANRAQRLTPPGHVHTMMQVDTYYPDIIRQGKLGRWAVIDDHTTLPVPAVRGYVFFILAGKVAALFNIDPVDMYELLRITGAVLVFMATYMLIVELLPSALHILAIVFILVIDTRAFIPNIFIEPNLTTYFGLPHHLWAEAMGLTLFSVLLRAIKSSSRGVSIAIILLAFIGTVTNPSYFVIITACVLAPWLLYALLTKTAKRTFPPVLLAILAILAAGLWIKYEFTKGPPWNALTSIEKSWWTTDFALFPFLRSFIFFSPPVIALLVLAPALWSRWSKQIRLSIILTAGWSFLPIALLYISQAPWFPIANGRITTDVSQVPIGILSTIGAYALWQKIRQKNYLKSIALSLFMVLIITSLYFSASYFKQSLADQDNAVFGEGYSWTLYPTNNVWNSMMALKNVPAFSHVMINPRIGELITAYLPLRVYQSAPLTFTDWIERRRESYQFYTGTMGINELRELLGSNKIDYVYYGTEEKTSTITPTFYPDILQVIYQNPEVTIYKVEKL